MFSLAELPELVGFFSYSRDDDEAFRGALTALREGVARELGAQLGRNKRNFRLWQDQEAIAPGKLWESEIRAAVGQAVFFIPIITPRVVNSQYCQLEFRSFLDREKDLDRTDLVFPILYITVPALADEARWRNDPVLSIVGTRQYIDWRPMRQMDPHTTVVREAIERFCEKIVEALQAPWVSPEERRALAEAENRRLESERVRQEAEADARRRAEEEAKREAEEERKRQELEAKRLAEEEARRKAKEQAERRRRETREAERRAREERDRREAVPMAAREFEKPRLTEEVQAGRRADEEMRLEADAGQFAAALGTPASVSSVGDAAARRVRTIKIALAGAAIVALTAILFVSFVPRDDTPPVIATPSPEAANAQRLPPGLAPPVKDVSSTPANVLVSYPQDQLCLDALNRASSDWDASPNFAAKVAEARRRGLTVAACRAPLTPQATDAGPTQANVLASYPQDQLCLRALNSANSDWDTSPIFVAEVAEARRRGLTVAACRAALTPPATDAGPTQANVLASYPQDQLCLDALNRASSDWDASPNFAAKVAEARRRGLTVAKCRAALGL